MENELNLKEEESILDLTYESSTVDHYDYESISTDDYEDIWFGSYVHPNINARDARLKTRDHIRTFAKLMERSITLSK